MKSGGTYSYRWERAGVTGLWSPHPLLNAEGPKMFKFFSNVVLKRLGINNGDVLEEVLLFLRYFFFFEASQDGVLEGVVMWKKSRQRSQ